MSPIKPEDTSAFRKLFNFLIKCQVKIRSSQKNPSDTSDIIFVILSKLPVHLQAPVVNILAKKPYFVPTPKF